MKNPNLPYLSIAAALRAYSYVLYSLDVLTSLGTTTSFSSLSKARVYYILARPYQLIIISYYYFLYLNYPLYAIFYINYYYIHYASTPPKAY